MMFEIELNEYEQQHDNKEFVLQQTSFSEPSKRTPDMGMDASESTCCCRVCLDRDAIAQMVTEYVLKDRRTGHVSHGIRKSYHIPIYRTPELPSREGNLSPVVPMNRYKNEA